MHFFDSKKRSQVVSIILTAVLLMTSCQLSGSDDEAANNGNEKNSISIASENSEHLSEDELEIMPGSDYSEFDLYDGIPADAVHIDLGAQTNATGNEKYEFLEHALVVYESGDYVLSGKYEGQIIVNAGANDNVRLIFDGADISNEMAPIYIVNAKNAVITLAEGSENHITDSSEYIFSDGEDEPNAAVFSKCDLTINGSGTLTVNGNYDCGIRSKDDMTIVSGIINVTAVQDGIKGRDSIVIRDGSISVNAGEDGLQSNNAEDSDRGYIIVEGGHIEISAGDDGIRAENRIQIYGGNITVNESYEGLEAAKIEIYGGESDVKAQDDGLNATSGSSSSFDPFGNQFGEKNWDKGEVFGNIPEGNIPEMPDGQDFPASPQDVIPPEMMPDSAEADMPAPSGNRKDSVWEAQWGNNRGGEMPGGNSAERPSEDFGNRGDKRNQSFGGNRNLGGGMPNEMAEEGVHILIAGGNIRVESGVDVIDSNGTFTQTGGTLITAGSSMAVYGSPEGIVDCNGSAVTEGGTFISLARSTGNNTDSFNLLRGFVYYADKNADFSAVMEIEDETGNTVLSFVPGVSSSIILVTSDLFEYGKTYTVSFGRYQFTYVCDESIISIQ